jgi:hypothetical protein
MTQTTAPPVAMIGNLDCETRWHGAVLPGRVLERISAAATLTRFLFEESVALWTPVPVDPRRICDFEGAPVPTLHSGPPPSWAAAAWGAFRASPRPTQPRDRYGITIPASIGAARKVNDRRFAAAVANRLEIAPAGAMVIRSVAELGQHLAEDGAAASPTEQWVCKAPLSAAGRDRVVGRGRAIEGECARAIDRLLRRFAALTFEPWLARICDLGVCAIVDPDRVIQRPPHTLLTTPLGGFSGISLTPPTLSPDHHAQLTHTVTAVGEALRDAGYLGPFTVDAFVHLDRQQRLCLRPLCEINARLSFGWIAAALADRYGICELHFAPAPANATLLLTADRDGIAAWVR